ncbi:hypothetical protein [Nocardia fluminea]|uniref:hypothetical protein n=1 Tax=Nocardia fluminea TaxID=134984 RepID=UPI003D12B339
MSHHKLAKISLAASAVVAALIATSAPAAASNYIPVELPMTTTGAHGLGCSGDVWAVGNVYPDGDVPGTVDLQLKGWLKVLGVPAPWCTLAPTVRWHNLDTGATGQASTSLGAWQPFFWSAPVVGNLRLVTGPGQVEFTLTTDLPHTPSVTNFRVY